ncbi:MAG: putative exported protein [Pseudomonadota bacterium]
MTERVPAGAERPVRWRLRATLWLRCAWAAPTSALGLLLAAPALLAGARWQRHAGVLEVQGGALLPRLLRAFGGAQAITLGHVVLARHAHAMQRLRGHERVHVRQCETWGPLFVPAYLAASAWAGLRGRRAYLDNPFEREAFALEHTAVALAWDRARGPQRPVSRRPLRRQRR